MLHRQPSTPLPPKSKYHQWQTIFLTSKSNYHRCPPIPPPPKKILHRSPSTTLFLKSDYHRPQTIYLTSKSNYPQCLPIPLFSKKCSPDSNQHLNPQQKNTQQQTSNNEKQPDTCERCSASIWSFAGERERLTVSPLPADGYQDCRYLRHLRCRSHRRRLRRRRVSFRRRCRRRASSALPPRGGGCPAYRRPFPVFEA